MFGNNLVINRLIHFDIPKKTAEVFPQKDVFPLPLLLSTFSIIAFANDIVQC